MLGNGDEAFSSMTAGDTGFREGSGASCVSIMGGRPLADLGLIGAGFLEGIRTPFGSVDTGLNSMARSELFIRPGKSKDGRGPNLIFGLCSYDVRILRTEGLLDCIEGRPSMLGLEPRNVSSNAFLVVPLPSMSSLGVGGKALSMFRLFGEGEVDSLRSKLGKVLGTWTLERLSVLSGRAGNVDAPTDSSFFSFLGSTSTSFDGNSLTSSAIPDSPRCRKESLDDLIEADAVWSEQAEESATSFSPLAVVKEKTVSCGVKCSVTAWK